MAVMGTAVITRLVVRDKPPGAAATADTEAKPLAAAAATAAVVKPPSLVAALGHFIVTPRVWCGIVTLAALCPVFEFASLLPLYAVDGAPSGRIQTPL